MNKSDENFWLTSKGLVALCGIAFLAYFLLVEHRHHLAQWIPYFIILLCPLMHIFMHAGHHGHHHKDGHTEDEAYQKGLEEGRRQREQQSQEDSNAR
jgi:hypothetical protein